MAPTLTQPKFNTIYELTDNLFSEIADFLLDSPQRTVTTVTIHRYFCRQKDENPDKYRDLKFNRTIPYSYELELVLNNLVRGGLVKQRAGYVVLTGLGATKPTLST